MKKILALFICLTALYMAGFYGTASADDKVLVRVGVYENEPRIFTDEDGKVSGFWPDIIEYIASQEDWDIQYIHGTWDECLERLDNQEIDVMPNVAYTPEWAAKYDYSNEPAYMTWAMIYTPSGTDISSILDLEGKKVAVMAGSNNVGGPGGIKELVKEFGVNCTFIYLNDYLQVFEMLDKKEADAGVVGKDFGYTQVKNFNIIQTPITFQPAKLYFAFPKGTTSSKYLVEIIDSNLDWLKADSNSAYYQSLRKWFGESMIEKPVIPSWLKWLLIGVASLAGIFGAGTLLLRYQVQRRTKELAEEMTERKQAERVLQASEEKYRHILESMMEGAQIISRDWRYVYINNTAVKQSRHTKEELLGHTMMEVYPGIEKSEMFINLRRCMEERIPRRMENLFAYPDGSSGWFELSMTPVPEGAFVLSMDISERKQAETALKESEEELRLFFEAVPDGITIADISGKIMDVNPALVTMYGYENKNDILGRDCGDFVAERHRELARQCLIDTIEQGAITNLEYTLVTKDGTEFPAECSTAVIRNNAAKPIGIIIVTANISARVKAQEEHRKVVEYRELDRLKTNLLSTISHELRTPLASIKGYASMLLLYDHKLDNKQKHESLEAIDRSTDRLTELIEHLLDMSRLDAGLLRLTLQPVKPREIITAAVDDASQRSPKFKFNTEITGRLPGLMADGKRLRQIIDNILVNAVKYSPEDTCITLQAEVKGEDLLVSITDQGRGIPESEYKKIFERMYRIEQRLKKDPGGLGLGLSLCKALVEAHGGRIWVESEIDKGSTFFFTIPLKNKAEGTSDGNDGKKETSTHN